MLFKIIHKLIDEIFFKFKTTNYNLRRHKYTLEGVVDKAIGRGGGYILLLIKKLSIF